MKFLHSFSFTVDMYGVYGIDVLEMGKGTYQDA